MHYWKDKGLKIRFYAARERCTCPRNKAYKNYGERGIRFEFTSPEQFEQWALKNNWAPGLYLDRIDNDGPYSPANCRFITLQESNRNRRGVLIHDGKTLPELCTKNGLAYATVRARIRKGMGVEDALSLPLTPNGSARRKGLPI